MDFAKKLQEYKDVRDAKIMLSYVTVISLAAGLVEERNQISCASSAWKDDSVYIEFEP